MVELLSLELQIAKYTSTVLQTVQLMFTVHIAIRKRPRDRGAFTRNSTEITTNGKYSHLKGTAPETSNMVWYG